MNIRLCMIFKEVVEQGSMSKAAKKLYMSQPAITHAIQDLELEIDVLLFDRIGRSIQVNEAGKAFYKKVCELLVQYDDLCNFKAEIHDEVPIRIGSSITIANFQLPQVMKYLHKQFSNPIKVHIENARDIIQKVKANELDFAFVEGNIKDDRLNIIPLSSYSICLFCAKESTLVRKKEYTMRELAGETFLLREEGSAIRDSFDDHMRLCNLNITPQWTSVNSQALLQGVLANQGIGVLPSILVEDHKQIHMLKIRDLEMNCPTYIIYQKGKGMNERIMEMIHLAKDVILDPS